MSSEAGGNSPQPAPAAHTILPAAYWVEQTLDDDADSSLGDTESSTASLSASILEYRTIHGRTFHSDRATDVQYWTPNDENATDSQDIIHHMLTLVHDGQLFRAPLKDNMGKALDIGTGSGTWAIDFADQFLSTSVIGTDISPIQPSWIPPNLRFEIEDATQEWTFAENDFDYVHMRYLFGSIADWPGLLKQAFRVTKPGGYVESYEASCVMKSDDGSLVEGSPMDQWGKVFVEAGRKFGRPFDVVNERIVVNAFEEAGFEEITTWEFKIPLNGWPKDRKLKEIGQYSLLGLDRDLEGWILFIWSQVMGWSREEIGVYVAHLRRQLRDTKVHGYVLTRAVYGRKPEDGQPIPPPKIPTPPATTAASPAAASPPATTSPPAAAE
ncbi:S-adenosyl-L-methionine-dependent methyltransferase [Lasiosphaeria hispida]|uniref:S-adenosyl-L-methionine-dependent methyltransferase n=1 Tax=Lasiosphaeria hispida TaxID=260671 RepID=A0AAJ0H8L5_9PEZI|nr:S-adenosyl-L-methionine-dependent methyltransferase [Lasiosphaeria hispida]